MKFITIAFCLLYLISSTNERFICSLYQKNHFNNCIGIATYCEIEQYFIAHQNELNVFLQNCKEYNSAIIRGIEKMKISTGESIAEDRPLKFDLSKRTKLVKNPNFVFHGPNKNVVLVPKATTQSSEYLVPAKEEKKPKTQVSEDNLVEPPEQQKQPTNTHLKSKIVSKDKTNLKNRNEERNKIRTDLLNQFKFFSSTTILTSENVDDHIEKLENFGKYLKDFLDFVSISNRMNLANLVGSIFDFIVTPITNNDIINKCNVNYCLYGLQYSIVYFPPSKIGNNQEQKTIDKKTQKNMEVTSYMDYTNHQ